MVQVAAMAVVAPAQVGSPPSTASTHSGGVGGGGRGGGSANSSTSRPASEIRFKEIANYVSLSLLRNPAMTRSAPKGIRGCSSEVGCSVESSWHEQLPATPSMEPSLDVLGSGDLPSVHRHGKSERIKSQLEWLRTEQRAEKEQLRKLDSCLSDSVLVQKRVQQRMARHQEMRNLHVQRATEMDTKIKNLRDQLATSEGAPRSQPPLKPLSSHSSRDDGSLKEIGRHSSSSTNAAVGGGSGSGSRRLGTPGLLAQSAERAATAEFDAPLAVQHRTSSQEAPPPAAAAAQEADLEAGLAAQEFPLVAPLSGDASSPPAPLARVRRQRPRSPPDLRPAAPQAAEEAQRRAFAKERIRLELKEAACRHLEMAGSSSSAATRQPDSFRHAKTAFKLIDLNGSGHISSQEFADGISRLDVNWQQITGLHKGRDLFNLFDEDRDFQIDFRELFPEEATDDAERPSTPDFCRKYVRQRNYDIKGARWQPSDREEELKIMREFSDRSDEAAAKRLWMRSTMRRLKTRGKSDGRCREVVAAHLPRGSGPKDREGVNTFTKVDLKNCRKLYSDEVNVPTRRMWKVVGDYKDQRREQKRIYDRLYSVTEGLLQRQKAEENLNSLGSALGGGLFSKPKEDEKQGSGNQNARLTQITGLDSSEIDELHKDYIKFADTGEMMGKRGFTRLLQALLPTKNMADTSTDEWWEQVRKANPDSWGSEDVARKNLVGGAAEDGGRAPTAKSFDLLKSIDASAKKGGLVGSRGAQCSFDQFCVWWADSQARNG